jgi:hypothetical protein
MASIPSLASTIESRAMPSSEELERLNSVLSKETITQRPKTEAQAFRRNRLNSLKKQTDRLPYKEALRDMTLSHFNEQMQSGGLTQIDGGKLAKRQNYQSSGVEEIEALISKSCGEDCLSE